MLLISIYHSYKNISDSSTYRFPTTMLDVDTTLILLVIGFTILHATFESEV